MASTDTANTNIFQRLQQLSQFQPATANLFADWTLDPGDVVTVRQGEQSYLLPIYQMNLDWKGQSMVEVQSTGSEQRPPLSELKRRSYAGGKRAAETEKTLIEHKTGIDKSNDRLLLWATESQWSQMAADQVVTQKSQFEITADTISSTVTGVVAEQFSSTRNYAVGDVCKYGGRLWTFIAPHHGDWNRADVVDSVNLTGSLASHQSQITQTRDSISLVVDEATGKVTPASLKLAINGDTSTIKLSADAIDINGVVTRLTGADVSFGDCEVTGTLTGHLTGDVEGNLDGDIIGEGHEGYFENGVYVGSGFRQVNVVDVQVNGNTLTITYADGTTVPFSKAATQFISGSWSGGVYTAGPDASSSTDTVSTDLLTYLMEPTTSVSGNNLTLTGKVYTRVYDSGLWRPGGYTGRDITQTIDVSSYVGINRIDWSNPHAADDWPDTESHGTLDPNRYYRIAARANNGTSAYVKFRTPSQTRTVSTLRANGGSVNVGSRLYTVNARVTYDDSSTGASEIPIAVTVGGYVSQTTSYPITVAGIEGLSISAMDAYDEGQMDMLNMMSIVSVTPGTATKASSGTAIVNIPLTIVYGDQLSGNTKTDTDHPISQSVSGLLQTKTATISTVPHSVVPDTRDGYIGLSSVEIPAAKLKDQTFTTQGPQSLPAGYYGWGNVTVSSDYTFSCTEQAARWAQDVGGYLYCGAISKSGLTANAYLRFRIKCGNEYKYCYITVNQ